MVLHHGQGQVDEARGRWRRQGAGGGGKGQEGAEEPIVCPTLLSSPAQVDTIRPKTFSVPPQNCEYNSELLDCRFCSAMC